MQNSLLNSMGFNGTKTLTHGGGAAAIAAFGKKGSNAKKYARVPLFFSLLNSGGRKRQFERGSTLAKRTTRGRNFTFERLVRSKIMHKHINYETKVRRRSRTAG
ncbi:hypothetical protein VIN7_7829 [Saccharomyces cerevisiae x Saccharomyces kudriavzevii VIN7]|uniref:Uncharacterized protein n=1 Tax=Saccharomyces cerevisiae x Saccharomyces kudriavzevii (strain VIN7) TaxID=1095631 RepID=H0GWG3_SACCK|nr:hypothetical protein VIN7_7829 [Saccharomyces cerevisiae x Saccharomyces kudriavzevii VIN7]